MKITIHESNVSLDNSIDTNIFDEVRVERWMLDSLKKNLGRKDYTFSGFAEKGTGHRGIDVEDRDSLDLPAQAAKHYLRIIVVSFIDIPDTDDAKDVKIKFTVDGKTYNTITTGYNKQSIQRVIKDITKEIDKNKPFSSTEKWYESKQGEAVHYNHPMDNYSGIYVRKDGTVELWVDGECRELYSSLSEYIEIARADLDEPILMDVER